MAEYLFTNLPQYVKLNSRSEFSSSVVSSGAVLLFTEDGYTLTGKLPDGTFITIGGSSGTDVSSTTAEAGDVISPKVFYNSLGIITTGTIQTLNVSSYTPGTSSQVISAGVYLGGSQTILGDAALVGSNILSGVSIFGVPGELVISSGAEVTLGYINTSGKFQPLAFSGTSAYDEGSAVNLSCYTYNLPVSSGSSGGSWTSSGVIIGSGVISSVLSGENWENTTVNSGGGLSVSSGGLADSTTVNPGGEMYVTSSGTATAILENGGYVRDYSGSATFIPNTLSGLTFSRMVSLHSVTNAISTTLNSAWMYLSGGTAVSTTVNSGGIAVSSGGTAVSTTVNSGGRIFVYSGGTATDFTTDGIAFAVASNTYASGTYKGSAFEIGNSYSFSDFTVSSGCTIQVHNGYTLNNITVLEMGGIHVYPSGSASNINISSGCSVLVVVDSSTYFQGTSGGSSFVISGGHVSNLVAAYGYNLFISSGGTASDITTYYNFMVYSGGTATNVNINGNGTEIYSGAVASGMTVNSSGLMRVNKDGVASNTTVNFGGILYAESGCIMNAVTVSSGGTMTIYSGASISNLTSMTGAVIINS